MAASRNFQEAIADEAGRQLQVVQAVRRQQSMVEAAKYGTQGTRSADNASGSNPFADALAKGAGELTRYGIGELFKDRSTSLAPVAYKVASSLPDYSAAFSPSAMPGFSPSWGFSGSAPSLAPAATQQAAALPNYSSVFAPKK